LVESLCPAQVEVLATKTFITHEGSDTNNFFSKFLLQFESFVLRQGWIRMSDGLLEWTALIVEQL